MKKSYFTVLLVSFLFSASAFESPLLGEKRPARIVKFSGSRNVTASTIEIVVPGGSSPVVRFAAGELRQFLGRRLGAEVSVAETPSRGKRSLILGLNALSARAGITAEKLCRDGFFIRSVGEDIYIAGRDDRTVDPARAIKGNKYAQSFERGTLFGVYDFLERFAGIRFYFPGKYGVVVPSGPMHLPEKIEIFDRPDLEVRSSGLEESVFTESPQVISRPYLDRNNFATHRGQLNPLKFLSGYRLRFSSMQRPNCHGLNQLYLGKRFAETKPEYFAMDTQGKRLTDPKRPHPFQLCYSSAVRNVILEDVEAYFRGETPASRGIHPILYGKPVKFWHPHGFCGGIADLQPQDSFFKCLCPKCAGIKTQRDISDMIWDLAIDAAERLKKKKLPGVIQMMSYYPYNLLPRRDIPDNFIVQLAVSGPWRFDFGAKMQEQDKIVAKWAKKCSNSLILWNYCGKFGTAVMPDIPHHTPRHIAFYYKRIAPFISGAKLLLSGDYYLFAAMNYYMFGKVTWNTSIDPDAILDEYYRLMFGAAAGEMKKVFDSLEENWIRANGRMAETPLGPVPITASQYELFEVFYSPRFLEEMEERFARAERLTLSDKNALERVKFMRWNFLDRIKRGAEEYFRHSSAARHFKGKGYSSASEEPDWSKVLPLYLQRLDGGKPIFETTFKSVLTPKHLKFRMECSEPEPGKVVASPDDAPARVWDKNGIELFVNASCDRKNYWHVMLSSANVLHIASLKMEGARYIPAPGKKAEIVSAVKSLPGKFVYEITFRRSDLKGFDGTKIVCNVIRNQIRSDLRARYSWSPFLGRTNHDPLKFGILDFSGVGSRNLLRDGTFSEPQKGRNVFGPWITNWHIPAGCSVSHDPATFISGPRSLRLSSSGDVKWFQIADKVQLEPGTRYRLSYFVKLDNVKGRGRETGVCVNLWSDRNRWFPSVRLTGTTPWIRQSFEFTTGKNEKTQFSVKPFMLNCSGTAHFDNISLEKVE